MIKSTVDHLGNEFSSMKQMCRHYGVSYSLYANRIRLGWTVERALTTPALGNFGHIEKIGVEDHLGNKFKSQKEMCEYWGISQSVYSGRVAANWTTERALTTPVHQICIKPCEDHLGNKYNSIVDMCRAWGILYSNYYSRLQRGWSLKETLETPLYIRKRDDIIDEAI